MAIQILCNLGLYHLACFWGDFFGLTAFERITHPTETDRIWVLNEGNHQIEGGVAKAFVTPKTIKLQALLLRVTRTNLCFIEINLFAANVLSKFPLLAGFGVFVVPSTPFSFLFFLFLFSGWKLPFNPPKVMIPFSRRSENGGMPRGGLAPGASLCARGRGADLRVPHLRGAPVVRGRLRPHGLPVPMGERNSFWPLKVTPCHTGLLKRNSFCNHLTHVVFSTKIKGNHHLQGNVQVYNVRIPV